MSYANTHRESPRHSAAEGDHYYNDDLYDAYTNAGQSSTSENPGYASQHYEDSSYYTAHDGYAPPQPPMMRMQNQSTPSLPAHPQSSQGRAPPLPVQSQDQFDPTSELNFSAMRIADPVPRAASAMSGMSAARRGPARHAATLPPNEHGNWGADPRYGSDVAYRDPAYSGQSARSSGYDGADYTQSQADFGPSHSNGGHRYSYPDADLHGSNASYDAYGLGYGAPPPQQQNGWQPAANGGYNPLYAAASDLLGPPPGGYPSSQSSLGASASAPYPSNSYSGQGGLGSYGGANLMRDASSVSHMRPPLDRAGTTYSMSSLGTKKTKAIDANQPPYTKEYVDQYRARMKADPDPEAHFGYAKYLIEAAKKIGSESADQRVVRKYRDQLIAESLKVIRRLATQGEPYAEAQFFLANCYGTGMLGLQVDHERAYHLYLQASKQNHAQGCYRVAVCNEIGAGTKREPPRAFAFYRKAASLGDTAAMYKLGMILLTGALGQPKNPREAVPWLKRAAEQADEENPHALHELGLLHEQADSTVVIHDEAYAKDLFSKAAQLGYAQSQFKLGFCYEYGTLGCPIDPKRSIAWYTKAAEKGHADAELALSGWYLTGSEGVLKQSDAEAYLWARRAANKGLSKAEYAVGYYSEVGIGVKQEMEVAKRWYMRAAAQGNKRAMNRLTELKKLGNKKSNAARPTRQQAKDEGCIIS